MNNKLLGFLKIVMLISIVFIISCIIIKYNTLIKNNEIGILSDEFLLSFIGLFAGLALAILSIFYVNIQKIKDYTKENNMINDESTLNRVRKIFSELRDDTICIVLCLLTCFAIIIIRDIESKKYVWALKFITKSDFFFSLKLSLLICSLISLFDISIGLFGIIKTNNYLEDTKK